MAREYIYICDLCGLKSSTNSFDRYELYTTHRSDVFHRADNAKSLDVCPKCAEGLIYMFKQDGEHNGRC